MTFSLHEMVLSGAHLGTEEWLERVFELAAQASSTNELTITVGIILWFLWKARNKNKFEMVEWEPYGIITNIRKMVNDVFNLQIPLEHPTTATTPTANLGQWSQPPPEWCKINIDGSYLSNQQVGGAAAVITDTNGMFVCAMAQPLANKTTLFAECEACKIGLQAAISNGIPRILIETDSRLLC